MTGEGDILEAHTLVIRDGRILDVLPHRAAAERYAPRIELDRPDHLAMPGLVNARSRIGAADARSESFSADGALLGIANMLKAGITCFCDAGYFPRDVAAVAVQQGLRAVIGLPVARTVERLGAEPRRISHAGTQAARRVQSSSVDLDPIRPASRRLSRRRYARAPRDPGGRARRRPARSRCTNRERMLRSRSACGASGLSSVS